MKYFLAVITSMVCASAMAQQTDKTFDSSQLSPKSRALLIAEMNGIKTAMGNLVEPLVSGDWKTIEQLASNIEQSFVFKQQVTPEIKQDLMAKLPDGFKLLDRSFHQYAASLSQAARDKDREQTAFYFYKMLDTCQSCHSRYASQRFSGLIQKSQHKKEH